MVILLGPAMVRVSLAQAKAQLSALVDKAETGEDVVITRHGKPVARLSAVARRRAPLRPLQRFRSKLPAWRRSSAALLRAARNEER